METILSRLLSYSKGFGWGPKPKSQKSDNIYSTLHLQEMHYREVSELKASLECSKSKIKKQRNELEGAKWLIKEQRKTSKMHARQMEEMNKIIKEMTRA